MDEYTMGYLDALEKEAALGAAKPTFLKRIVNKVAKKINISSRYLKGKPVSKVGRMFPGKTRRNMLGIGVKR